MSRGIYYKGADGNWHSVVMPYIRTDVPVPTTINLSLTVNGAGGGAGGNDSHAGYAGSAGHQLTGTLTIPFGKNIQVYIGGAGAFGASRGGGGGSNALGYSGGGGGYSGNEGGSGGGGGGGGATVVLVDGVVTAVAAGGGGGGGGGNHSTGQPSQGYASSGAIAGGAGGNKTSGGEHGGKIICTKLYELGLMDKEIYEADQAFGAQLVVERPDIYNGYRAWAEIVVDWMEGNGPNMMPWLPEDRRRAISQSWSTSWAMAIATPWAEEMAYKMGKRDTSNLTGRMITAAGIPICKIVGVWQRVFGPSKKSAGFGKGLMLIPVFVMFKLVAELGKRIEKEKVCTQ
jgi:hypothetical protein